APAGRSTPGASPPTWTAPASPRRSTAGASSSPAWPPYRRPEPGLRTEAAPAGPAGAAVPCPHGAARTASHGIPFAMGTGRRTRPPGTPGHGAPAAAVAVARAVRAPRVHA